MDTLYIGDIPLEYHYCVFSNDYITLYNKSNGRNETLNYYRIYKNYDNFMYSQGQQTFGQNISYFQDINVSNSWLYRNDIDKIFLVVFIIVIMFLFVFNIATSIFKKGGVFGGLI